MKNKLKEANALKKQRLQEIEKNKKIMKVPVKPEATMVYWKAKNSFS